MTEKTKQTQGVFDTTDLEKEIKQIRNNENEYSYMQREDEVSRRTHEIWSRESLIIERQHLKAEVEKILDSELVGYETDLETENTDNPLIEKSIIQVIKTIKQKLGIK